jgi:hypothetical protein
MAKNKRVQESPQSSEKHNTAPRSLAIAARGIATSHDFANLMSSLMSDLIEGTVAPNVGNATCNAGGKLLRIVELQYKYGTTGKDGKLKTLTLTMSSDNAIEGDVNSVNVAK